MMFLNRQEENLSVQQTRLLEAPEGLAKGQIHAVTTLAVVNISLSGGLGDRETKDCFLENQNLLQLSQVFVEID
jgi:hypothetical protein